MGAIASMTFLWSACAAVRFDACFTIRTGQTALRLWLAARAAIDAAASLTTFLRRSLPRFWPLESIGVDEPMFEIGDIARTSAASPIQTPADAARAPCGETYTITGTLDASSFW